LPTSGVNIMMLATTNDVLFVGGLLLRVAAFLSVSDTVVAFMVCVWLWFLGWVLFNFAQIWGESV
jgi:hypothetical protein